MWLSRTRGSDEWDELLTVVPATGAVRAYQSDGTGQEMVGAPEGFVIGPGKNDPIVLGSDGTVAKLRQVVAPTSPDRQGLVRPVTNAWSADPVALTWWPEVEEGEVAAIDDHGRVWLVPQAYPAGSGEEVVIPEWGQAGWWYVGQHDAAHSESHAHRTHAFNSNVVVVGDRVALVSGAWIDQSRDDMRTWKATRMDERWMDYWNWFGTPSGRLFSAPLDDQRVFLRNRDESWTTFETASLPRGFSNLQAAGDLLWSVRYEYVRKNAQLPVAVVISDDDGDTWRHVWLGDR